VNFFHQKMHRAIFNRRIIQGIEKYRRNNIKDFILTYRNIYSH